VTACFATAPAAAQDTPRFTPYFSADEFQARRSAVADAIGEGSVALVQGAPSPAGYVPFRQSNEFFYLSGIETPHAYLLVEGGSGRSTLYLPHRNARRESSEGRMLSAEDAALVRELTGAAAVFGVEMLNEHLARRNWTASGAALYTPFAPAEGVAMSRDLAVRGNADIAADPWDGRPSREGNFASLLRKRLPRAELRDLTPTLDSLRLIKSAAEIALIRRATDISNLTILEAMRSTRPGMMEYELDALANFVFLREGAQHTAYYSLVGAGPNAWYPHYHQGGREMQDGDFLLVDVGPDFSYYSTDVTRMLPVNGRFNDWQRELYGFYLATYRALLDNIRPGEVADIARDAAAEMETIVDEWPFSKPEYEAAARRFVGRFVASANAGARSLGHWVGMAVHDVGPHDGTLRPGMVFTIEPQFRVPEEQIYIRLEDMILITKDGVEILSQDLPLDIEAIEAMMQEPGLLERYPALLPALPAASQR
jgi:Xaa-Pro aminopeptidase